jgi:pimeloyl-ACP methyl ester carboxylesterase
MAHLEKRMSVDGGSLYAVADGDGPPVVLLHAGIADHRAWDAMVPFLVDAGYRAIRFDLRGVGRSSTDDVTFSRRADTLAVLDGFGVRRAALVGNSIGGMVALDTALEQPDRVVALVLVATGIGGFHGPQTPAEDEFDRALSAAEEAGDADEMARLDVRLWVDGVGQPETRVDRAIRDLVYEMDRPSCEPGHVSGRPLPLEPPADERLGALRVPTLAVAGGLDTVGSRAAAERIAREVPGARSVTLPDVAHMIGMERPAELTRLIVDHLRPLGSWA